MVSGVGFGGNLAAAVVLRALKEGLPGGLKLRGQMLLSPLLDDRQQSPSYVQNAKDSWSAEDSKRVLEIYLGRSSSISRSESTITSSTSATTIPIEPSIYTSPNRAEVQDLVGSPETYIDAASNEVFRDEGLQYAVKLWAARTQVELHVVSNKSLCSLFRARSLTV